MGAFEFDSQGNLIDYKMVLSKTSRNRGGGKTPWNTWISCEEIDTGRCYQVDPTGQRESQAITVGQETGGGMFESFTSWTRFQTGPHFFLLEEGGHGTVRRFVPDNVDWSDPWNMLIGGGRIMYLMLDPSNMTFSWASTVEEGRSNAALNYPGSIGAKQMNEQLYFVSKGLGQLMILSLLDGTYTMQSTDTARFKGLPDQVVRIDIPGTSATLYFSNVTDGTGEIGARNEQGTYTIIEAVGHTGDNTTGLAFSPDGKHLYFAIQGAGLLYDISRDDGRGFDAEPPVIVYETEAAATN